MLNASREVVAFCIVLHEVVVSLRVKGVTAWHLAGVTI